MRLTTKVVLGVFLFASFLSYCETDPVIYVDSAPTPVIYCILDNKDLVHYIRIGRTFGAEQSPAFSAALYDSLNFPEAEVKVHITFPWDTVGVYPEVVMTDEVIKDSGLFYYPTQLLYKFNYDFHYPSFFLGKVKVSAEIPDLPPAAAEIHMVTINRDSFSTPKLAQQYVFLNSESPFRVHWRGHYWNEIDVAFTFEENLGEFGRRIKTVHIQDYNYYPSPHSLYREMKITYNEFLSEVLQQISVNDSVRETYLGYISIEINGGDHNMSRYMQYYYGFSDYNTVGYTNIENGLGLLASRTSILIDSMQFDRDTKRRLWSENRLRVLKLAQ